MSLILFFTINALRKYFKLFAEKCLCIIYGENVIVAEKEMMDVCFLLNEVDVLPNETVINLLTGLINFSVPDFVKLFDFLLQQAKAKVLDTDTHERDTFEQVKTFLSKAVDADPSLHTTSKRYVSNKPAEHFNVVCWNYEMGGCSVNKCPRPRDEKR